MLQVVLQLFFFSATYRTATVVVQCLLQLMYSSDVLYRTPAVDCCQLERQTNSVGLPFDLRILISDVALFCVDRIL